MSGAPAVFRLRPRSCKGVTLIELLTVIFIIMLLMGLLMSAVAMVRKKSRERATTTLISALSAAMERYHVDWDDFPDSYGSDLIDPPLKYNLPGDPNGLDYVDDGRIVAQMNGPDGKGFSRTVTTGTATYSKWYEPYLPLPAGNAQKKGTKFIIVDAFGFPLRYLNCEAYIRNAVERSVGSGATEAQRKAAEEQYKQKVHSPKYDIYSLGADGKKEAKRHNLVDDNTNGRIDDEAEGGDDITTWD